MDISTNFQVLITLVLFGSSHAAHAIIECPITGPLKHTCVCTPGLIDCDGHNLTTYPSFLGAGNFATIRLGNNTYKHVPGTIFASTNASEIDLSNNHIATLDIQAFTGVEDTLKVLKLANNSLTSLPAALNILKLLSELDVSWNPISGKTSSHGHGHGTHSTDGLTDSVMRMLGANLVKFSFGSDVMTTWPSTLNHLNRLEELTVKGLRLPYWPAQSFHGFEQTLKSLTIDAAYLEAVPLGISFLTHLEKLHLDNLEVSPYFGDDSMISAPFSTLGETLRELSLKYDGLTTFPEGIKDLRKLTHLILDGNNLEFVSDEAIKLLINANVSYLSLKDCNLKRIPGAISDLTNLMELDLSNNKIRSIESTDLQHLKSLQILILDLNPLIYISDNFSCGLVSLKEFYLKESSLTKISQSFKNLHTLEKLDLTNSKIDCTCDLTWIFYWKDQCSRGLSPVQLLGDCETIDQDIQSYVDVRLRTCPGFIPDRASFNCNAGCSKK